MPRSVRCLNGVNFQQTTPLPQWPSDQTAQVDIYEPSKGRKTIQVPSHVVIFFKPKRADGGMLAEEYPIEKKSQPPGRLSFSRRRGHF